MQLPAWFTGGHPAHTTMASNHYTFGDTDQAHARLDRLAEAYEVTSRAFLRTVVPLTSRPDPHTLDLGCGPGHTTVLLAEIFRPHHLDAYDVTARCVALTNGRLAASALPAARRGHAQVADVATNLLVKRQPDLIYARHLLAHLRHPGELMRHAAAALAPRGVIALEETADLASTDPRFQRYYDLVSELQLHYGQQTRVGRDLADLAGANGLRVVDFTVRTNLVAATTMAALHEANLATWSRDPFARDHFDPDELADLQRYLHAVATGGRDAPPVSAPIGQLIACAAAEL